MNCGLLGENLQHSYSPQIHNLIADYPYSLLQVKPDALSDFFDSFDFTGINVTIPYKKAVLPYCHKLSDQAKKLGSVNTIVRLKDGTLYGHNTDYFGFQYLMKRQNLDIKQKTALVLGSGGASVTVAAVLEELGANVVVISRTGENNYTNISRHKDAALIVNTTPVGMYPENGIRLVNLSVFHSLECVVDIIYNPSRTKLLLDAESRGIKTENGLPMLVAQAVGSAKLFTNQDIPDSTIETICKILAKKTENIILIGMPGCGKTTVGKMLAEQLGREFIDADKYLEASQSMTVPKIREQYGEPVFRKMESRVLQELGKRSGLVISTGGGCVTIPENYDQLHQNGQIIWLKRDLGLLPTEGRPLSQTNSLQDIYSKREPLYQKFADIIISNDDEIANTVNKIIQEVYR